MMHDDFLLQHRPVIRREFAEALAGRLDNQARRARALQRAGIGLMLALALILGTLGASPGARAAVTRLIREISGMTFIECEDKTSCMEARAELRPEEAPSEESENSTKTDYVFDLDEVRTTYSWIDGSLPSWAPEGFTLLTWTPEGPTELGNGIHVSVSNKNISAAVIWTAATANEEIATAPWISLSIWIKEWPMIAKSDTLKEITVDGHPAAISELHAGKAEDPYHSLDWRQNGVHYSLAWPAERFAQEDALRMAASVPELDELPVEAEELLTIIQAMLAENQ